MNLTTENIILIGSILLLVSVFAGRPSYKFGVPTLIFFLGIGMLAGSEGIGGIYFDDPKIAQFIGIIALNFILFSGGFDTSWTATKTALIVMIQRNEKFISPTGATVLEPLDKLYVLSEDSEGLKEVYSSLNLVT
jgi:NhaP-type Na+/H+ and K+/H+ antiporter